MIARVVETVSIVFGVFVPTRFPQLIIPSITDIHEGAITSVQFNPSDSSKALTNGMDSKISIVDLRTCKPLQKFGHAEFRTSYSWSSSSFSPDGRLAIVQNVLEMRRFLTFICLI